MFWFTTRDGTRFLAQTPLECAASLARAFPEPGAPVTSERFLRQIRKDCPPPRGARAIKPVPAAKA